MSVTSRELAREFQSGVATYVFFLPVFWIPKGLLLAIEVPLVS